MNGLYILDGDNNPVEEPDLHKWAAWLFENQHRRRTAYTEITDEIHVSTIFRAATTPEGKLWETMVRGGPDAYNMYHWDSHQQALQGHEKVVAAQKAKAACANDSKSAHSASTPDTTGSSST